MKLHTVVALIVGGVCFGGAFFAAKHSMRRLGPHHWAEAHVELRRLERELTAFEQQFGSLPSEKEMNRIIRESWDLGAFEWTDAPQDQLEAMEIIFPPLRADRLDIWSRPPVFTRRDDLPNGFGLYLHGEDGHSNSKGSDRNDINSWTMDSAGFYYRRLERREFYIKLLVAGCIGFLAFASTRATIKAEDKPPTERTTNAEQTTEAD